MLSSHILPRILQNPPEKVHWPIGLSSLRYDGYRVFLLGQSVALLGTWVQGTAQRWLVLELTGSTFYVGLLGMVTGLPILLFAVAGGILADRVPKISFLMLIHSLILLQALVFGFLVEAEAVTFPLILLLASVLGAGMAFEVPARQSLVFDLVGRQDITNGIAVHSAAFNLARFGGPALAGLLMSAGLMAGCFFFKALSSICIIASLLYVRRRYGQYNRPPGSRSVSAIESIKEAFVFVAAHRLLSRVLAAVMCFGILLLPYSILLPSLGRDVLGLGAGEYGFMCAANGLGALAAAVFVAVFGHRGRREHWWWAGSFLFPASIIPVAAAGNFHEISFFLFLSGFVMVITSTSALSILQIESTNELRGRVMGLFSTCFMGLFPFGSLLQGFIAQYAGIRTTMASAAGAAFFISLVLYVSRRK